MAKLKMYILYRGPFGEQIINNLVEKGFADKITHLYELQPDKIEALDELWEDPERYLPRDMPLESCDLLLVLGIHPKLGDLVPTIAKKINARAVLYPIDDQEHVPEGLKAIKDELDAEGISYEFPEPFCSLDGSENELINYFAKHFGKPKFKIGLDRQNERIKKIEVIRDTPCGSASCVAQKLLLTSYGDRRALEERIANEHSNISNKRYCLASMDPRKPLMQKAADLLKEALYQACGF
jgi:hypothetical protein